MAIYELDGTTLVQRCAKCNAETRIALDALEVGVAREDQVEARLVPLPPCSTCRSTEWLVRSPEDEPPHPAQGSLGHLHRLLVDHVHAVLVGRGRVVSALKDERGRTSATLARPPAKDELQRWFPKGLKIALPEAEARVTDREFKGEP